MFKKGNKIVCVSDDCYMLKKYEVYTIDYIDKDGDINICGYDWCFYKNSVFISLKEYRKTKIRKNMFKTGDRVDCVTPGFVLKRKTYTIKRISNKDGLIKYYLYEVPGFFW